MADWQRGNVKRPMSEINVVPFIDVMLVLLVIFMMTAPLLTQGVKVELPKTEAKAMAQKDQEPLIVTVNAKGEFFFNLADKPSEPITARTLSFLAKTQLVKQVEAGRPVLVRGDANVNYGKVMEAMVLLQQAGAKSVGLITQPLPITKEIS